MELMVLLLTGALLLAGVVSGGQALRRWMRSRRAQHRYRRGLDEIPIVFPKELRVPAGVRAVTPVGHEAGAHPPQRERTRDRKPKMDLTIDPPPVERPKDAVALELPPGWGAQAAPPGVDSSIAREWEDAIEGTVVRSHRTNSQTMRLLPGRLEVEEGEDGRTEIRFVDVPSGADVTFGRRSGEPFRHVQLRSPTVSREHARMVRNGGDWVIENLSETNPILVNGVRLPQSERLTLKDGDRVEMGEVVFRYRYP